MLEPASPRYSCVRTVNYPFAPRVAILSDGVWELKKCCGQVCCSGCFLEFWFGRLGVRFYHYEFISQMIICIFCLHIL